MKRNPRNAPITIRDRTYRNAHAASKAMGVSLTTIYDARRNGSLDLVGMGVDAIKKRAKVSEAVPNTPAVIGQTTRKVKPCVLCGTFNDVTITYAVPLDRGGWDSEWNHHVLCLDCRAWRAVKHYNQSQMGGVMDQDIARTCGL